MKKKIDNRGFSLVELIVVIAIVVILATAVVVAFVNSESQKTKASASLVSNYLDNVMNYTLTKGNEYFTLRYDSSGRYYVEDSVGHSEKLSPGIKVSYDIENGEKGIPIEEGNDKIMLSFSRTNGSYTPLISSVNDDGSFNYVTEGESTTNLYADKIYIQCNDTTKVIHMYTKTGAHDIEER